MKTKLHFALLFSALALIGSAGANAAPVLTNGGFETGDFTGWTQTGNSTFNGVECPGAGSGPFQGNCDAFFGPVGSPGGISQTITGLIAGQVYNLGFAFRPDGGTPSLFSATFGTQTLLSLTNPPASPYQAFSFAHTAAATSEVLAFNFRDDPGFLFLDAVTVSVAAQAPEPAALALLGLGLAGLGFSRRKRA